ncbi:hypothetical protein [Anabaena subtropica]|uniref:Uncharacterized protein n=1 Tax=Anabaena subtropica FACHB-260 TaxID=2692884 RepID=A0ABR8CLK1_9NOST|nr:hypothetical protein [Anabaena subtropica]MBD2343884.1 hypothetical protein [Anabaena subtropica FACHB-260]
MRVWLACFLVLFALAELFDWLKAFTLPLPIYILGGAFLAVASNYDKIIGYYFIDATIEAALEEPRLDLPSPSSSSIPLTASSPVEEFDGE